MVVATHWHDDHISGLAQLLNHCKSAKFCASSALSADEFVAMVTSYDENLFSKSTSGVREIHRVFDVLKTGSVTAIRAAPDRPVFLLPSAEAGHGHECRVTTLSPSDKQVEKFYYEITKLIPTIGRTKERCTPQGPNHLTVAVWIEVGPIGMLFGGDLEETADPETGWSVIVGSKTRPRGKARIFKIPHHGSSNGHNDDVWGTMLVEAPFAVLTPYNRGYKLPKESDTARINALTPEGYSTSRLSPRKTVKRAPAVERTIREAGFAIAEAEPPTGLVRFRNGGGEAFDDWRIELAPNACRLSDLHEG